MSTSKTLTTISRVAVAALIISTIFAGYYLLQYQQAENNSNLYLSELKSATSATTTTTTVVSGGQTVTSTVTGTVGFAATTDILINFENGTQVWSNDTTVQPGWNAYEATVLITGGNMNATWYAQYKEHLVTGIDGVQNSASSSWFLWTYNSTALWQVAQTGADQLPTTNGSIYAWSYCG